MAEKSSGCKISWWKAPASVRDAKFWPKQATWRFIFKKMIRHFILIFLFLSLKKGENAAEMLE